MLEAPYHDGIKEVPAAAGRAALVAFAVADHERSLNDVRDKLAQHEAKLAADKRHLELIEKDIEANKKHLLPSFGNLPVGFVAWITVGFFLILAVVSVGAEYPLSRLTVLESFGGQDAANKALMDIVRNHASIAVAVVLCLIGFSLKLLADVLDRGKRHYWWEIALVTISIIPCVTSIAGVAEIRQAIEREQITATGQGQFVNASLDSAAIAAADKQKWASFTFKWVTIGFPLFSAMCLIVSLHQFHNYRTHNRAVARLLFDQEEFARLDQECGQLQYAVEDEGRCLDLLRAQDPYNSDFRERSLAAYDHGRSTGVAEQRLKMNGLRLYPRLQMTLKAS